MNIGRKYLVLWNGKLVSPIKTFFGTKNRDYLSRCCSYSKIEDAYKEINRYGDLSFFSEFVFQIYEMNKDGVYEIFDKTANDNLTLSSLEL